MAGEPPKFLLAGVVNNPRESWMEYLGLQDMDEWTLDDLKDTVTAFVAPVAAPLPPARSEGLITLGDFRDYLQRVGEPYRFLAANRPQAAAPIRATSSADAASASASLDAAASQRLGMVPEACFDEDFDLSRPETFATFSPPDQPHTTQVTLERLTHYLDQVPTLCPPLPPSLASRAAECVVTRARRPAAPAQAQRRARTRASRRSRPSARSSSRC